LSGATHARRGPWGWIRSIACVGPPSASKLRARFCFMSKTLLHPALGAPFSTVVAGFRFWRQHGALVRRARALLACADQLRLRRVRGCEVRSLRLYRRAAGILWNFVAIDGASAPDRAHLARQALRIAQAPYRAMAAALAVVAAGLGTAVVILLLLASAVSPNVRARIFPRDLAAGRPWTVSSTEHGFPTSGVGPSTDKNNFFHTGNVDSPYLEIDLGAEHLLRRVVVENRPDCCQLRALPLNIEVLVGSTWRLVAQRRTAFVKWDYDIDPIRAQRVRVRRPGQDFFHLRRVSIYGQ
jgi:hypothetical protein